MADDIIPKPRIKRNGVKNKGRKNPINNLKGIRGPGRPFEVKWDWAPAEERYVKGYDKPHDVTGVMFRYYPTALEVAAEFGIPPKTVTAQCTEKGWVQKREEWMAEVKKAKDAADLKELVDAEMRIRRKALTGAEKIIDKVAGTEGQTSLVDSAIPEDLPALAVSLRRAQETAHVAIGLPKDGVKQAEPGEGNRPGAPAVTVWAAMRSSRQDVVVGVQVVTNQQ